MYSDISFPYSFKSYLFLSNNRLTLLSRIYFLKLECVPKFSVLSIILLHLLAAFLCWPLYIRIGEVGGAVVYHGARRGTVPCFHLYGSLGELELTNGKR